MSVAYYSDETIIRATARNCFELVLAVRRYGQWWRRVRCEPLGREGVLRVGGRFRLSGGPVSWVVEVTRLDPWRRIDLRYAEGDMLGPVSWEFAPTDEGTRVRYSYRGVRPNSAYTAASFASGRSRRVHSEAMQEDAFPGMRLLLESGRPAAPVDPFEAIATLGATRRYLPDPIDDATLRSVIEAATYAPSARNAQPWYFVAVRDETTRERIAALYLRAWEQANAYQQAVDGDADIANRPGYATMMEQVDDLARHFAQPPILILACLDPAQLGPMADGRGEILSPQSAYASIFPAVQNLMLAAHSLGLGTTLTTLVQMVESEVREAAGIPPPIHIAALLPLGYPARPFRPASRKPVRQVAFLDRWGQSLR